MEPDSSPLTKSSPRLSIDKHFTCNDECIAKSKTFTMILVEEEPEPVLDQRRLPLVL